MNVVSEIMWKEGALSTVWGSMRHLTEATEESHGNCQSGQQYALDKIRINPLQITSKTLLLAAADPHGLPQLVPR